jgi:hypothetical protein
MKYKFLLLIHCALLLSACTSLTQQPPVKYLSKESQSCANFFIHLEQTISTAGIIDSEAARITTYPYLRINRFLSDFRHEEMDTITFNAWVDRMQNLAMEGWDIELNNLSNLDRKKLSLHTNNISSNINLNETVRYCGELLRTTDLDEEDERLHLKTLAKVPDEYKTWQRVVGLYPLTALVFRSGIDSWHKETNNVYAQTLESLTVHGELLRYLPSKNNTQLTSLEVSHILKDSSNNTLNIPEPSDSNRQKLFDSFSPIFEVDIVTNDDRIGTVKWGQNNTPQINTDMAKVYQHLSYTRVSEKTLLQLNYTVWFPSRPKTSTFDMLGGNMDGITWRVTLLPNGKPWLFDTIHNCGCYHLFFPTQHATILPQASTLDEPAFIPQSLSATSSNRQVIRIAHGTHYIERVYFNNIISSNMAYYQSTDSKSLRSLELNNGERRSLYGQDGIIKYSKRGERYLFWPMGIPNPGAMRQWGHHATAFVGRRHFDDARLFEKYFGIINSNN